MPAFACLSGLRFLGLEGVIFTRTSSYLRALPASSDNNDHIVAAHLVDAMHHALDYTKIIQNILQLFNYCISL